MITAHTCPVAGLGTEVSRRLISAGNSLELERSPPPLPPSAQIFVSVAIATRVKNFAL